MIEKLSALNPLPIKFVFRDSAFDDNIVLKDETFRRLNALIDKNTSEEKKTYKNIQGLMNTFVENKDLSICLINTQAFASDTTKIKNAQENGVVLWDELKSIKPIVIIDEPQRVEGTKKKPSKSKQALCELNPLFTLKYSATHRKEFPTNFVYKLDSYGAFANKLVKSIKVKTVYGTIPKDFP